MRSMITRVIGENLRLHHVSEGSLQDDVNVMLIVREGVQQSLSPRDCNLGFVRL